MTTFAFIPRYDREGAYRESEEKLKPRRVDVVFGGVVVRS